jgi:hypothetical protein
MSKYRIIFEEPPAPRQGQGGPIQAFIHRLRSHPNRWAVLTREAKYTGYYYNLAKNTPDLEVRVVTNPHSKTNTVYFRITPVAETASK